MASAARKLATYADVLAAPEHLVAEVVDGVCAIASPSTRALDRGRKADLYAREGVRFLWLVDVIDRFVEAYELVGARWQRIGAFFEPEARIAPFDAIALDLAAVFGPPPASPPQAP